MEMPDFGANPACALVGFEAHRAVTPALTVKAPHPFAGFTG